MLIWGFVFFVCVVCLFGLESCSVVAGVGSRSSRDAYFLRHSSSLRGLVLVSIKKGSFSLEVKCLSHQSTASH